MKRFILNILFSCSALMMFLSCTEKHELYNVQDCRLSFTYQRSILDEVDSISRVTFVYDKTNKPQDTVWIEMTTMGFLSDKDRAFELQQVPATMKDTYGGLSEGDALLDAVPGTHYVPFDSDEMKKYLVVKSGENKVRFPVILKRDESLLSAKYYLKFMLKPNDHFIESYGNDNVYVIEVTEMLVKPKEWEIKIDYLFAGKYGPVKLRFMIDNSYWNLNDQWFADNFSDYFGIDEGYTGYLSIFYTNKLIEYNRELNKDNPDKENPIVLTEADGTPVQFVLKGEQQPYI